MFCATQNISFAVCLSFGLNALLQLAGAKYTLPSRYTFHKRLVEVYASCCERLRATVQQAATEVKEYNFGKKLPFLHLTSDFWTAKHQNKAYGTVVVAFVNSQWELCIRTLGTCYMGGTKTADRLARWVAFVLRKATGLKMDSVVSCTSDGASDMK